MFKIYRSTSQILHNNRPSGRDNNKHLPAQVEDRIRRKSRQLVKTEDSRQMFGQARSIAQNTPTLKRNRSSSYSKPKIFEKARQVKRNETFHKTLATQNTMNSCLGASNFQFSQYKKDRSKGKLNEVVERKLIISKVLSDLQESKPRLTLRGQILKNQEEKRKEAEQLEPKHHKPKQDDHLLGYSQSKFPSELIYSKQFSPKNDPYRYNESLNLISTQANQLKMKQYSQQLAANIQQSIKKQMEEHYLAKEKQLQEKYIEKEKLYLERFKDLEVVMETQLEKERKILIQTINQQLEKQISKVSQAKEESKRQRIEGNRGIQQSPRIEATPRTVIESKQEEVKRQTKQMKPSEGKTAQVVNIFNQSEPIQIQQFNTTKKVEASQRKKSTHAEPYNLPPKQYDTSDNTKLSKPIKATMQPPIQQKNRKKSNYNDDSYLQQIQEITLEKKPETNMIKRQIEKDRVNQSFNIDKKLNSSFSSQRPLPNQGKTSEQQKPQRKLSQHQKHKQQKQQRKAYIRAKLKQQIQNDANLIAIGEVAGYCSKYCKKSKIDWRISSLLLYRYCFDFFRSFKDLYEQANELNLIKKEELDKYHDYDTVMGANLSKMYKVISKKITLSSVYASMIESDEIQLERLKPYVIKQAKKYVKELASSAESSPRGGDYVVVQCGLRVINSVFIIKRLNGIPTQLIQEDISSLDEAQTFSLFEEWSSKLLEQK